MYIKELQLNDFKSFHEQDFKFYKGLTVVTGSNGSGKSNIFDAIVFALGNNSSKTLRYKHINELIHKGQDADFAKVKLVFDDDTSIERYVSDGASVFRLNDKRTTMEAISAYLKEKKLSYSGHNIVLQDDVKKVVEMSDVDRRKYVDEIANISKFDEQKQKALKNLETVANKINEVKLVLNERKEWLTKLESEKSSAERYLQLDRQKLLTEATILKKERKQLQKDISTITTRQSNLESELLESSKKISELVKQIGLLESNLKNKRTEFEQESKNFSGIDSKFNVEQYKEFSLRNELNDKQNVLLSLEKSMISFKEIKDGLEHQRKETEIKLKDLTKKISDMNNELKKLGSLDTLKQKVSLQDKQNKDIKEKINNLDVELKLMRDELRSVEVKEALYHSNKEHLRQITLEINNINELIKKENIDFERELNNINSNITKQKDESDKLQSKLDDAFKNKVKYETQILQLQQEIKTLENLDFKTQDPIFVNDNKEIDEFIAKKESKNEFGTFVFLFKNKQDYSKDLIIKNVLPSNKISKLELELSNSNDELNKQTKIYNELKQIEIKLVNELRTLSDKKIVLDNKIKNRDVNILQYNLRLKNLESEKLKYDVEEKIQDKSKIIKQIEELTKQREQLSSNISSEDINILSNYLDKMDVKSESEKDLTKLNVDLARFEEKIDAIVNDNKKSQESHIELSKQIKELKTNLEHQEKIVNSLSKEKHQFESKLVKLKSETEELEKTLVEIKNEKNHLNDFIVKGESDKEHLKESIFLKEKQLDEKIKEIKDFVEFNKNKDIDFESFDEFENKGISELRESIIDIKIELEGLGSVNLKAIADYNELFEKYGEVLQRMNILDDEKTEVLKDIEKITLEKEKVFMNFYNILRTNFKRITKEFGLGDIDFVLTDKDLDVAGIQIVVKRGKYERQLNSLSGGEKSLTTIAFVLSIVEIEPAPFYLFDEIDAALDFKNTEKILDYLKKLSHNGQIIMISHNPESVEMADYLIGISKNRLGITAVGVKQNKVFEVSV